MFNKVQKQIFNFYKLQAFTEGYTLNKAIQEIQSLLAHTD